MFPLWRPVNFKWYLFQKNLIWLSFIFKLCVDCAHEAELRFSGSPCLFVILLKYGDLASTSQNYSDSESDDQWEFKSKKFENINRREIRPQKYRIYWETNPNFKYSLKLVKGNINSIIYFLLWKQFFTTKNVSQAKCSVCDL